MQSTIGQLEQVLSQDAPTVVQTTRQFLTVAKSAPHSKRNFPGLPGNSNTSLIRPHNPHRFAEFRSMYTTYSIAAPDRHEILSFGALVRVLRHAVDHHNQTVVKKS